MTLSPPPALHTDQAHSLAISGVVPEPSGQVPEAREPAAPLLLTDWPHLPPGESFVQQVAFILPGLTG